MVVVAEYLFLMAVPMGPAAALVLEADPKLVASAACVAAHENVPREAEPVAEPVAEPAAEPAAEPVAEPVAEAVFALEAVPREAGPASGLVLAPEADSRMAEFEGAKCLWGVEAGHGSE